ncbi:MAG TPA: thioredoxin family protein [Geminicoccaceae bacterium]
MTVAIGGAQGGADIVDPAARAVSRDEWLAARKAHLRNEKALTRMRDLVSAERRALPWVKIEKDYAFDAPDGRKTLADLFGRCSQLIIHHFMFAPDWEAGCPSCSLEADHAEGAIVHLENHDVAYVRVSRAPLEKLESYRKRMGWKAPWVSSYGSDFNHDFHVSFTKEELAKGKVDYNYGMVEGYDELPGLSVFYKDENGAVFHTYSSYARGNEEAIGAFIYLDITPRGRNETEIMDWVRRHDEYGGADARQTSAA